mmetsp:Transcript_7363/g.9338  ORF Transcript_7363/g.9338 Transcript_7363/m.9338 type:complete len:94 (+) Transcript_7363:940-1221(+)
MTITIMMIVIIIIIDLFRELLFFFLGLASGLVLALLLYLLVLLCKRCRKPFSKTASHEAVTMLHIKGLTNSQFEHESIEEDLDESKGVELGSV